jgi:hypothetical protein
LSAHSWLQSPPLIAIVIFALALWPRILDLNVFVGPDEFYWLEGSAKFTGALASGDLAQTYHAGQPGVTLMWIETLESWLRYGRDWLNNSADWAAAVGATEDMATLASKRQVVGVANAALVALCVLLVCRVFDYRVAWLTGFLLAFDPFVLTESRALRTEGLLTGLATLALLALLLYQAAPRLHYAVLSGVLLGLALLSKVSAISLLPIGALVIGAGPFFEQGFSPKERRQKALLALLVWAGVSAVTIIALWPALWVGPIQVARQMYEFLNIRVVEGEGGGKSFFLGQAYLKDDPGSLFYPVVLLYRTGPVLWLGLALLVAAWPTRWLSRQIKVAVGIMLLYLIPYLILITLSELKFDRYVIPMLPTLNIIAALGLVAAWQWLTARDSRQSKIQAMAWLLALLVLGGQIALALPHHPYYYTFWNPLLGGIRRAAQILPVGIGGEGLDRVAAYLNTLPRMENLKVASANSQKLRPLYRGKTIPLDNVDGRWVQADYVSIYISQLQRGKHDPAIINYLQRQKSIQTVTLYGLEYAWLYPGPAAQYYGGGHTLEGRGTLFGYNFCPLPSPCKGWAGGEVEIAAGDTLPVTLFWRNEGQLETDRFFVRLMDLDGYVWAEAIARPRPGFEEANRQRESIVESEAALTLPVGMPPGDYFFKPGFRTDSGEIIGYFELPEDAKPIHVTTAAAYPQTFQPPRPFRLVINADLALAGYNLEPETATPGASMWVTLYWQALANVTHDYIILLRLLDQDGQEAAYWLGRPVRSGYPSTEWRSGQIVQDPWRLQVPTEIKLGPYNLEVALFDAASEAEVTRARLGSLIVVIIQ